MMMMMEREIFAFVRLFCERMRESGLFLSFSGKPQECGRSKNISEKRECLYINRKTRIKLTRWRSDELETNHRRAGVMCKSWPVTQYGPLDLFNGDHRFGMMQLRNILPVTSPR